MTSLKLIRNATEAICKTSHMALVGLPALLLRPFASEAMKSRRAQSKRFQTKLRQSCNEQQDAAQRSERAKVSLKERSAQVLWERAVRSDSRPLGSCYLYRNRQSPIPKEKLTRKIMTRGKIKCCAFSDSAKIHILTELGDSCPETAAT